MTAQRSARLPSGRFPAVSVLLAFATGIVLDRQLPESVAQWLVVPFVISAVLWLACLCSRRRGLSALLVLLHSGLAGALHHHQVWSVGDTDDLANVIPDEPVLVRMSGRVADHPRRRSRTDVFRPQTQQHSELRFHLQCDTVSGRDGLQHVSGQVLVTVDLEAGGEVSDDSDGRVPARGDAVVIRGWVSRLPVARNPGDEFLVEMLRRESVRGSVHCPGLDLLEIREMHQGLWRTARRNIRRRWELLIDQHIGSRTVPIARAMLLGDRSQLDDGVQSAFIESGTMHLLAISGLHIGILSVFLFVCCRMCRIPVRATSLVVALSVLAYIDIADSRPPMIRAGVLTVIGCLAVACRRPALSVNSLACSGLVILLLNPAHLFDIGAQLSFMAIITLMWVSARLGQRRYRVDVVGEPDSDRARDILRPRWQRWLLTIWRPMRDMYAMSGAIWLVSAPLVASVFHVVSLAGLVINVLLIPVVSIGMCCGFFALLVGTVSSALAAPFAALFGILLAGLRDVVALAAKLPLGHFYFSGPPPVWLPVLYSGLAVVMLVSIVIRRRQPVWPALLLWCLFTLAIAPPNVSAGRMTCSFRSVGHGVAVVIETPGRHVLVYDVGSRSGGETASRSVLNALWSRQQSVIDVLVLSHADMDHYNGAATLANTVPVRELVIGRQFVDTAQPLTVETVGGMQRTRTRVRTVGAGDTISLDDAVSVSILHPVASASYPSDNEASVVVLLEYAGRRILLTGDLAGDGLAGLLTQPALPVDVLLAPHHGDHKSNTFELARWSRPKWVVASSGRGYSPQRLESVYGPGTTILHTHFNGAATFTIDPTGEMHVETHVTAVP